MLPLQMIGVNGQRETKLVTVDEYPRMLALFVVPPPGIFTGRPPSSIVRGALWTHHSQADMNAQLIKHHAKSIQMAILPADLFMRMLAKIAHAYAVAQVGIDGFRPFLPPLILKSMPEITSQFVGGDLEIPPREDLLHNLQFNYRYAAKTRYLVVSIRLFAMLQAPLYHVAVGQG